MYKYNNNMIEYNSISNDNHRKFNPSVITQNYNYSKIWGQIKNYCNCPLPNVLILLIRITPHFNGFYSYQCISYTISNYNGFYQFNINLDYSNSIYKVFVEQSALGERITQFNDCKNYNVNELPRKAHYERYSTIPNYNDCMEYETPNPPNTKQPYMRNDDLMYVKPTPMSHYNYGEDQELYNDFQPIAEYDFSNDYESKLNYNPSADLQPNSQLNSNAINKQCNSYCNSNHSFENEIIEYNPYAKNQPNLNFSYSRDYNPSPNSNSNNTASYDNRKEKSMCYNNSSYVYARVYN